MSIVFEGVIASARELRACRSAWKSTHRIASWQTYVLIGVLVGSIVAAGFLASGQTTAWVGGTAATLLLALTISGQLAMSRFARTYADVARARGASRWTFDLAGFSFESRTSSFAVKWEGVSNVIEEADRFVFAVSPAYMPVLPKRVAGPGQAAALATLIAEVRASGRLGAGVDYPPPSSDKA